MIKIENLKKSFGSNILFDNFNLEIKDGDFVCITGDSGSGKTTLLNMIGLIEPFDEGKITFDGNEVKTRSERLKMFREQFGFIFQNFVLIDNKTVKENLELIRKEDRTDKTIDEILEKVGIADKKNSKVYTLSGGEQQRVAMARLYLKKCKYVFADEPTGSLDRKNADTIFDIFQDLNNNGKTIIIVTHDDYIKDKIEKKVNINDKK